MRFFDLPGDSGTTDFYRSDLFPGSFLLRHFPGILEILDLDFPVISGPPHFSFGGLFGFAGGLRSYDRSSSSQSRVTLFGIFRGIFLVDFR